MSVLLNISQATSTYEAKPKFLEEKEFQIAEQEIIPNPSQTLAVLIPDEEETPVLDFIFEFEDEYFTEFGNTLNYHTVRKPQGLKSSTPENFLDFTDRAFLKKTTK
jgi:hypothetical protein